MSTNLKIWYLAYKNTLIFTALVIVIVFSIILWSLLYSVPDPVPANIKHQINFSVIYPANYAFDSSSWQFDSGNNNLVFKALKGNYSVVFTEQKVPLAFQDDMAAYDRFVGSLRPFANFNTSLGTVSLTNFVTAGDFQPEGQSAVLDAKGTFLIAHPSRNLEDNEWRDLFADLKVD